MDHRDSRWDEELMFPGYRPFGVEIKTPMLRNCQASYDHIRTVLAAINRAFRVRVNPSCGIHCHVGAGTQLMTGRSGAPLLDAETNEPVSKSRTFSLQAL